MKTKIFFILLLFITFKVNAQKVYGFSNSGNISIYNTEKILKKVQKYVNDSVSKWQQKGLLEKTNDYKKRVNEVTRQKLSDELTQKKVNELERLATALYVTFENKSSGDVQRAQRIHDLKPHVSIDEALEATKTVDQFTKDSRNIIAA